MKFYWVFGGTAVGKKTFILNCVNKNETTGSVWFEDGEMSVEEILKASEGHESVVIRWQWGREHILEKMLNHGVHTLMYLYTSIENQKERVIQREGYLKWSENVLRAESKNVQKLTEIISMRHGLSLFFVKV